VSPGYTHTHTNTRIYTHSKVYEYIAYIHTYIYLTMARRLPLLWPHVRDKLEEAILKLYGLTNDLQWPLIMKRNKTIYYLLYKKKFWVIESLVSNLCGRLPVL